VAKARAIPGLDEEAPYAAAAASVVAVRARELADLSADVLDTADIEPLHDMRVATRRLRAALEAFRPCFPKKPFKSALGDVKELADALGERRDRDVAIASLEEFAERAPVADRAGVLELIDRLRAEQADANRALVPYVEPARIAALQSRLEELSGAAAARAGEGRPR
jgi:CHAD domain-containing protein